MDDTDKRKLIAEIASRFLRVKTLDTRNRDCLDFYDCAVWNIEEALNAAFELGVKSVNNKPDVVY